MTQLAWGKMCIFAAFCLASAIAAPAQVFKSIESFDGPNGAAPNAPMVQGTDGNLYGTAAAGGANGEGEVYRVTPEGGFTVIYNFCTLANCADGSQPYGPLVLATDGNFYGTTGGGGAHSRGTVFKMTPQAALTTLYSFTGNGDGSAPVGLVQATDGSFYGTTELGANVCYGYGCGTVFRITAGGELRTLYQFCAQTNCPDGGQPVAGVVQGSDGNFYGTTSSGGTGGGGTVFKITPAGALTTLYNFCSQPNCADGGHPSGLVQATNGNFYGTTFAGANENSGTVFEITPDGELTTIHSFCARKNCNDGSKPQDTLVQASDGNLYGTAYHGGTGSTGNVFAITLQGELKVLYNFCMLSSDCADGAYPGTGLVQATNGNFYGTTVFGGTSSCETCGTVFGVSLNFAPFVEAVPNRGSGGQVVGILGNNLAGTTSVTFNGVPSTFSVVGNTVIKATVPSGATTGTIQVTTPGGPRSSNVAFQVAP